MGQLNVLAVHLFILYYSMLAAITPPVAVGSFVGAAIAGANPMKTSFMSMRLGVVIYFIPFFFVFNPALVLQGPLLASLYHATIALLGVALIAAGMEGCLFRLGTLVLWSRPFLVLGGLLIAFPEWITDLIGGCLVLVSIMIHFIFKKRQSILA